MLLSLAERINVLKELKLTPDVSTRFRPPCCARSLRRALTRRVQTKHYDFQWYPLPKHHTSPKLWYVAYLLPFYDISISWLNLLNGSDFIFHLRDGWGYLSDVTTTNVYNHKCRNLPSHSSLLFLANPGAQLHTPSWQIWFARATM